MNSSKGYIGLKYPEHHPNEFTFQFWSQMNKHSAENIKKYFKEFNHWRKSSSCNYGPAEAVEALIKYDKTRENGKLLMIEEDTESIWYFTKVEKRRKLDKKNWEKYNKKLDESEELKQRSNEYLEEWKKKNARKLREYHAEYMRKKEETHQVKTISKHSLPSIEVIK